MKRAASILMALMAGALLGGAAGSSIVASAATPVARFEAAPCTVRVPSGQEANIRCGWVTVPEDRTASGGGAVRLAVAVLKATGPHRAADPILYLSGGPGGPSLRGDMQAFRVDFAAPWQTDRDLVFYDQRGTGISEPGLYCNQPADPRDVTLQPPGVLRLPSKAPAQILACRDRLLAEGVRLSAYNSAESARDIQDVMTALGYERWNLLGVSYGTRLALTAMRDTPSHIRSVVLDSTLPLQVETSAETARNFERSLDTLIRGCRADAACRKAYPDQEREYFDLIARANANPIVVTITGNDGKPLELPITGDLILRGTWIALYSTRLIPLLPFAGDRIAHGDVGLLTVLAQQISGAFAGSADGMTLSVQCSEEWPFLTQNAITVGISGVRPQILAAGIGINNAPALEEQQAICEAWGTKQPKAIEDEPVQSNIPTLVLAGEYDPITPPRWGQLAASTLSNSRFYQFPANGHGVIYGHHDCASIVVASFVASPATAPDSACIAQIPPPAFQLPAPEVVPAPPAPAPPSVPQVPAPITDVIHAPDTGSGPATRGSDAQIRGLLALVLLTAGYAAVAAGIRTGRHRDGADR